MTAQIKMPAINANEEQGRLSRWLCEDGAPISVGTPICEVETTKATIEIEASSGGFLRHVAAIGASVSVGGVLAVVTDTADEAYTFDIPAETKQPERRWTKKAFIVARRLGIDIEALADAKQDVVTEDDVTNHHEAALPAEHDVSLLPLVPPDRSCERILLLAGAGGAGAIALDAIRRSSDKFAVGIIDNNTRTHNTYLDGVPVLGGTEVVRKLLAADVFDGAVLLYSEDIEERKRQFEFYRALGVPFTNLVDPSVQIRKDVQFGTGNVVLTNCFFAVGVEVGDNNFFASHTVIEHHSRIGNNCTFGPRTTLSGRVTVHDMVKFGMSVSVEPYLTIGENSIIASGKVITTNVSANARVREKITQSSSG